MRWARDEESNQMVGKRREEKRREEWSGVEKMAGMGGRGGGGMWI